MPRSRRTQRSQQRAKRWLESPDEGATQSSNMQPADEPASQPVPCSPCFCGYGLWGPPPLLRHRSINAGLVQLPTNPSDRRGGLPRRWPVLGAALPLGGSTDDGPDSVWHPEKPEWDIGDIENVYTPACPPAPCGDRVHTRVGSRVCGYHACSAQLRMARIKWCETIVRRAIPFYRLPVTAGFIY